MILCAFCLWEIHWETTRDVSHRFFLSLEETKPPADLQETMREAMWDVSNRLYLNRSHVGCISPFFCTGEMRPRWILPVGSGWIGFLSRGDTSLLTHC